MQSNFSTLCRGFLVPKEIKDKETVTKFLEAVGQFESIMNDSGFITLTRLTSGRNHRNKGNGGYRGEILFTLTNRYHHTERYFTGCRRNEDWRQYPLPAYPFGCGRYAGQGGELIPAMKSYPPTGAIADYLCFSGGRAALL